MAGVAYAGFEAEKLASVVEEDFAVADEIVGLQGGGAEGGFGVEEAG